MPGTAPAPGRQGPGDDALGAGEGARPGGRAPRRLRAARRAPRARRGRRHRAGAAAPLPARRRRAPARPGRHRAHRHPARAPPGARAPADHLARARRVGLDGVRHRRPAEVRRGRGRGAAGRAPGHPPRRARGAGHLRRAARAPAAAARRPRRAGGGAPRAERGRGPDGQAGRRRSGARARPHGPRRLADRAGRGGLGLPRPARAGGATWPRWARATRCSPWRCATRARARCPPSGNLALVDPETGRHLKVDSSDARLRERYARAERERREAVAADLRRAGAEHVVLDTAGDWLRELGRTLR